MKRVKKTNRLNLFEGEFLVVRTVTIALGFGKVFGTFWQGVVQGLAWMYPLQNLKNASAKPG
ncbi:MAG TPA: hypothetical protein VK541_05410 [Pedobacter sp.]|uniref:hypothetical protein n=1 Tax=Pedobacter sp. TaxID=1411316 RepID=UPI002B6957C9|nr:hypothetical protein [Pedobacter sp.]HMI01897.1 hypothetical protein [Pedobacter sp.]